MSSSSLSDGRLTAAQMREVEILINKLENSNKSTEEQNKENAKVVRTRDDSKNDQVVALTPAATNHQHYKAASSAKKPGLTNKEIVTKMQVPARYPEVFDFCRAIGEGRDLSPEGLAIIRKVQAALAFREEDKSKGSKKNKQGSAPKSAVNDEHELEEMKRNLDNKKMMETKKQFMNFLRVRRRHHNLNNRSI